MFRALTCAAVAVSTIWFVSGEIDAPDYVGNIELTASNTSNVTAYNITIDINNCLPTLRRTANCLEKCGKLLSQPPNIINTYESVSFEVQSAITVPNITVCEGGYYLLNGVCDYTFEDILDNNKTYIMEVSWFLETNSNQGFNLVVYGPTVNDTDPSLHTIDYKDISGNDQLICWWAWYNTTNTANSCATATNDPTGCAPQSTQLAEDEQDNEAIIIDNQNQSEQ